MTAQSVDVAQAPTERFTTLMDNMPSEVGSTEGSFSDERVRENR
jgi:hypothetical protein